MLETDIDIRTAEIAAHVRSLARLADALPSLGMVAAVLGATMNMVGLQRRARGNRILRKLKTAAKDAA